MFTNWVHSHHRSILFLLIALAVGGLASSLRLPVALFPQMHFPRVVVDFESGDRPAERMATEVTYLAEEAIRAVEGVRNIRSTTSRGSAEISINFDWEADMTSAMLQVESAVNQVMHELPQGTTFSVRRMDPTVFPVICYSLTSDTSSGVELYDLAQYQIRPILTAVNGVAKIDVISGGKEEIRVDADPAKLASYGLSLAEVSERLSAANVLTVVGRLEDHCKLYLVVANTSFADLPQIAATVLKSDPNGIVLLGDVAKVYKDAEPAWSRVTADGHDAVIFQIYQQPGGNTVQIAQDVKDRLAEFRLPKGVTVANWYDQSELIISISSARSVRNAVLIGVVLAVLILLVFLRNIKTTLIAGIIVPAVLAVTVLMLFAMKMSFNIMTLGGMAAAVGLIIDDSIVLIEHIVRRLRSGDGLAYDRVKLTAVEFSKPLSGSSASTIVIFVPLAFLSGVTGAFFKALSLTMAASLLVSFLAAYLAVPLLAGRLLNEKDARQKEHGPITRMFHAIYRGVMGLLLPHPWMVLAVIAPVLAGGYYCYQHTGSGFMPKMVGVRLWVPWEYRNRQPSLGELQLRAPDGHLLPLSRIATVTPITGQPEILRDDLKRMVAVTGRIVGRDMGSTIRDVKAVLARPGLLPAGVYYRLGGLYKQRIAFEGLVIVLAAAVVLVFLLLLFLYERFRVAVAMLLTTLLATAAVFVGLWLTGTELNITSMMGLTMVVGIVTEVGIFYYSEYRDLPEGAQPHDRFILAGVNRMRPIAMTTLAAILALMPLALGWGQGSSMERPLAIAIISGLAAQLPLALVVLPSLLRISRSK